ncbi:MAG: DUF2270 domain-containing protein [Anaerolineae bacterium]
MDGQTKSDAEASRTAPESSASSATYTYETATSEPVWTFRGYRLRASEFNQAMIHFFRSQVSRADVWRQRLDMTTNWAVLTTGATISVAFTRELGNHSVIILNALLVTLFLFIEARRYRFYEVWSTRVRLMETDFFAAMLVPPFQPAADWAESLAENLLQPHFTISLAEALGRRYRRNYIWIYFILAIAWLSNVWMFPTPVQSFDEFLMRAALGPIPGWLTLAIGFLFNIGLLIMGLLTVTLQEAAGEVWPRYGTASDLFRIESLLPKPAPKGWRAWFRRRYQREQLLALIITDQAQAISDKILHEMKRGVTALTGTGMYTGQARTVLMCALTVTEVHQLRSIVGALDPQAVLIVSPAREVSGGGFTPLREKLEF